MMDNVLLTRDRLLCGHEEFRYIVERNIVCHNALTYDYSFNGTNENLPPTLATYTTIDPEAAKLFEI